MICKKCSALMRYVMRFEADKATQLYRCPVCYFETKATPLFLGAKNHATKAKEKYTGNNKVHIKKTKKKVRIRGK